jgi:universal stress protein E
MQQLQRILVATDFSAASRDARREAIPVARAFGSDIILVHALQYLPHTAAAYQMIRRRLLHELDQIRTEILRQGGRVTHQPIVEVGSVLEVILSTADRFQVNVILLGTGEKHAAARFLLGTTAARVMRRAVQPVWVVQPGKAHWAIRRILCAVDFSEPATRALRNAILLSRTLSAALTVLHVIDQASHYPHLPDMTYPVVHIDMQEHDKETRFASGDTGSLAAERPVVSKGSADRVQRMRTVLERLLETCGTGDVSVKTLIRQGVPAEGILQTVRDTESDLVAMGSVGRTGLPRVLMGNTAEKVVREVPCSLLTVKNVDVLQIVASSSPG